MRPDTLVFAVLGGCLACMPIGGARAQDRAGQPSKGCPNVAGHYSVTGSGTAMADALKALGATAAGFPGSEVKLSGLGEQGLGVWLKSGSSGALPSHPNFFLVEGSDFTCAGGRLVFPRLASTSRKIDEGWYSGESTVRLGRGVGGGLGIEVAFAGRQRTTLYSYDSAHISVPKPGTGTSLRETINWAPVVEPEPEAKPIDPTRDSKELRQVRQLLDSKVLGNVTVGGLRPSGDAVLVTLNARDSEDAVKLEDRLRAASIRYQAKVSPIWTNNAYHLQLLVWPTGSGGDRAWRPSVHRVQHEILRVRQPMVDVRKVEEVGDGYVATLSIVGSGTTQGMVARLKANSDMFSDIQLVEESLPTESSRVRTAQLKLRVR